MLSDAVQGGFFEVAPALGYPTETSFPRVSGAILTGSGVDQLPLAYQQILFDSFDAYYDGSLKAGIESKVDAIEIVNEKGLSMDEASPELQEQVKTFAEELRAEVTESGVLGEDIAERFDASREHWTSTIEELGYEEAGDFEDMDEWYDPDTDYTPLADALFEEAMLEHRPS